MALKVLILGAGAVGAYYGYVLGQAGAEVSVQCRSDYELVKSKGFSILSQGKRISFHPFYVFSSQERIRDFFDVVLVASKVLPEVQLIDQLKCLSLSDQTTIVLLQNGIDIERDVVAAFGHLPVLSGIAFVCLTRQKPGFIEHKGFGRLILSSFTSKEGCLSTLVDLFCSRGLHCERSYWTRYERWKKLIWNVAFNPLSVISGLKPTSFLLEEVSYRSLVIQAMKEVILVASCEDCFFDEGIIDSMIANTLKMGDYYPSMVWDARQNRSMEVDAILGSVVVLAQRYQVEVPLLFDWSKQLSDG